MPVCAPMLVLGGLIAGAPAQAQAPGSAQRLATLLQFYGGGAPLTAAEQADVAGMNTRYFAAEPRQAAADDALNTKIIATLDKGNPRMIAKLRSIARFSFATPLDSTDPVQRALRAGEVRIVDAHDPIVVVDTADKGAISRHTIDLMLQANAEAGPMLGVPGPGGVPGGVTADALAARLKADFAGLGPDTKASLASAELHLPDGLPWLRGLSAQQRAGVAARFKPMIVQAADPAEQQVRLAEFVAAAGTLGSKAHDSGVQTLMLRSFFLSRLRMQGLAQGALNSTARGY